MQVDVEDETLVLKHLLAAAGGLPAFQRKAGGSLSTAWHSLEPALTNASILLCPPYCPS